MDELFEAYNSGEPEVGVDEWKRQQRDDKKHKAQQSAEKKSKKSETSSTDEQSDVALPGSPQPVEAKSTESPNKSRAEPQSEKKEVTGNAVLNPWRWIFAIYLWLLVELYCLFVLQPKKRDKKRGKVKRASGSKSEDEQSGSSRDDEHSGSSGSSDEFYPEAPPLKYDSFPTVQPGSTNPFCLVWE